MPPVESSRFAVKGNLVLKDRVVVDGILLVDGEQFVGILDPSSSVDDWNLLDYSGRFVLPGLVDTHIHTGSTPTEGIARATAAAASGGVTTAIDMPFDHPDPLVNVSRLEAKVDAINGCAAIDLALYGTMAKFGREGDLEALLSAGVAGFKFSMHEADPHRLPGLSSSQLLDAFQRLAPSQIPIVVHAENQDIVHRLTGLEKALSSSDSMAHARSRPLVAENAAVAELMELAFWTGARVHVAHVTNPHAFSVIDFYRSLGAAVSGETCIHYLTLTNDALEALGARAKVSPPLRDSAAVEGLWQALAKGSIASLSSDHAPWPKERKERPILEANAGMPGLETLLPVLWTEGSMRNRPIPELIAKVTWEPAGLFGLNDRKGALEAGKDADFCIFDTRRPWQFDSSRAYSSGLSAFEGRKFSGRVETTYLRGKKIAQDGVLVSGRTRGKFLRLSH